MCLSSQTKDQPSTWTFADSMDAAGWGWQVRVSLRALKPSWMRHVRSESSMRPSGGEFVLVDQPSEAVTSMYTSRLLVLTMRRELNPEVQLVRRFRPDRWTCRRKRSC
jgi:hypothetical protein